MIRDTILLFLAWNRNFVQQHVTFDSSFLQAFYGVIMALVAFATSMGRVFLPVIYPLVRQPMTPSQLVHG